VQLTVFPQGQIIIGEHVALNGTAITAKKKVEIGAETMIAANVIIVDSDFHATWPPEARWSNSTAPFDQDVHIGRSVWIGMNSIILKGTRIGDNSIIGAGSVVSGEIPANCVAAGNPAKIIRFLEAPEL
jgi:acetyltransferase-like isoleucine patch superfamily enzyme